MGNNEKEKKEALMKIVNQLSNNNNNNNMIMFLIEQRSKWSEMWGKMKKEKIHKLERKEENKLNAGDGGMTAKLHKKWWWWK